MEKKACSIIRAVILLSVILNVGAASAEIYPRDTVLPVTYVDIDKTPPSSTFELNSGWYNYRIRARLIASDALSGIAAVTYTIDGSPPVVSYSSETFINLSSEGIHEIRYFSIDNANNAEKVRITRIKLDFTPPEIITACPSSREYLRSDIIEINFSAADALSGIYYVIGEIDGTPVMKGDRFDMSGLTPGEHEFTVYASDEAHNVAVRRVRFTIISSIDSLMALNSRAVSDGWITGEQTARSLSRKLIQAKQRIDSGQNQEANSILKSYINEVEAQREKTITEQGAALLTTEAAYVYIANYDPNFS